MGNIIGNSFKGFVDKQVETRQKVLSSSFRDQNFLKYLSTAPVLATAWLSFTAGFIIEIQRYMPDTLSFSPY